MSQQFFFFSFVFFFLFVGSSFAFQVVPAKAEHAYVPGTEHTSKFTVNGLSDIDVKVGGDLTIDDVDLDITPLGNRFVVELTYVIPEVPGFGQKGFYLLISEKRPELEASTIDARVQLKIPIRYTVPYPDSYLELDDIFWDKQAFRGNDFYVLTKVKNIGQQDLIDYESYVVIFNGETEVDRFFVSDLSPISAGTTKELVAMWTVPEDFDSGRYEIMSVVEYGSDEFNTQKYYFQVGDLDVNVVGVSTSAVEAGTVTAVDVTLESKWGEELDTVAVISLLDASGTVVGEFRSATVAVPIMGQEDVTVYVDATDLQEGIYTLQTYAEFADQKSEAKIYPLQLAAPGSLKKETASVSAQSQNTSIGGFELTSAHFYLIIILAVAIIVLLLVVILKKR